MPPDDFGLDAEPAPREATDSEANDAIVAVYRAESGRLIAYSRFVGSLNASDLSHYDCVADAVTAICRDVERIAGKYLSD